VGESDSLPSSPLTWSTSPPGHLSPQLHVLLLSQPDIKVMGPDATLAHAYGIRLPNRNAAVWRTLSAADRKYGDVSPDPRAAPRTPGASSRPARPYTGSAATDRRPPCRRRARPRARRLGSARGSWIPALMYPSSYLRPWVLSNAYDRRTIARLTGNPGSRRSAPAAPSAGARRGRRSGGRRPAGTPAGP